LLESSPPEIFRAPREPKRERRPADRRRRSPAELIFERHTRAFGRRCRSAWQPPPSDPPHVRSEMANTTAAIDKPKCQSPGAACQPATARQRILLIRGLMDYMPGISPMTSLKARLANEGYDVTMITHMTDGFYKNQYWDAVIGHSQGAIDALRDAPDFARYNPRLTIIAVDPPRTSVLFHCVRSVRYLDLHTGDFGLGGGSLSCPQAQN